MEAVCMATLGYIDGNTHSAELDLFTRRLLLLCVGVALWLILSNPATASMHNLLVSDSANRSNPVSLSGQAVSGNIYVYTGPDTGIAQVSFYLDDPTMSGSPHQVERYAPYDFAGGNAATALPLDTTQLASGSHTVTALIALSGGGSEIVQGTFTVSGGAVTGSATLSWVAPSSRTDGTPLSLSAIKGYRVYHATGANQLSLLVSIDDPTATAYTVSNLAAGTHKFAVTVCDTAGFESDKSSIKSEMIQ
jgi:hypothetical protein